MKNHKSRVQAPAQRLYGKEKILAMAILMVAAAQPAMAQDLSPVTTMLTTIITAVTGPIGRAVAILGLIATGVSFLIGRINWMWFVMVLIGVVIVFRADTIVDGFAS